MSHCDKDSGWVVFQKGEWRFDPSDGYVGIPIEYCPFCGEKLEPKKDDD